MVCRVYYIVVGGYEQILIILKTQLRHTRIRRDVRRQIAASLFLPWSNVRKRYYLTALRNIIIIRTRHIAVYVIITIFSRDYVRITHRIIYGGLKRVYIFVYTIYW